MRKYLFGWVQHKAASAVDIAGVTGLAALCCTSQTNYANDLSSIGSLQDCFFFFNYWFSNYLSHAILCSVKLN